MGARETHASLRRVNMRGKKPYMYDTLRTQQLGLVDVYIPTDCCDRRGTLNTLHLLPPIYAREKKAANRDGMPPRR